MQFNFKFKTSKRLWTLKNIELIIVITLFIFSLFWGIIMGNATYALQHLTGIKKLENYVPEVPTQIFDCNDRLIAEYFHKKRVLVPLDQIPEYLEKGIIAVEDNNFYRHWGIDPWGILRAFIVNLTAGRIKEGGSTITQQLAKVLLTSRKKSYLRKIKEIWFAFQLEKMYTKNEILELYFNQVYLGHGCYGVESAANFYFEKGCKNLNLAECAMIVGLPSAPNRFSPFKNPEKSQIRQWKVLKNMAALEIIDVEQAKEAFYDFWMNYMEKIQSPSTTAWSKRIDNAPYFTEYIRRILEKRYGSSRLYTEGLKVYTTLDLDHQKYAEEALNKKLRKQNEKYYKSIRETHSNFDENFVDLVNLISLVFNFKNVNLGSYKDLLRYNYTFKKELMNALKVSSLIFSLDTLNLDIDRYSEKMKNLVPTQQVEGAVIAIEPDTGYIKAMIGGSGFKTENQLNRAVQIYRQPGSAFKPFVYTAAIDSGIYTPSTIVEDSPIVFLQNDEEWVPNNYSGKYAGNVTLRKALQKSINIISVKLTDKIGLTKVIDTASKMLHIRNPIEKRKRLRKNLSVALGTVEVSPLEMATAFSIFANRGEDVIPISIRHINDKNDNLIYDYEGEINKIPKKQVLTPQVSYVITSMLKSILKQGGTAWGAVCQSGFHKEAAGKTGTTDNWRDTWFVGFTPQLSCAVWVGFDKYDLSLGRGQEGGSVAAPVWMEYMNKALSGKPAEKFEKPDGISEKTICEKSGNLARPYCSITNVASFISGTEPTDFCETCRYSTHRDDTKKMDRLPESPKIKPSIKSSKPKF